MPKPLTVDEAAKQMGVTPLFLRCSLRQDKFPFGAGVNMGKSWRYYINEAQFKEYMEGKT